LHINAMGLVNESKNGLFMLVIELTFKVGRRHDVQLCWTPALSVIRLQSESCSMVSSMGCESFSILGRL
jgi:hypothetical protein